MRTRRKLDVIIVIPHVFLFIMSSQKGDLVRYRNALLAI